MTYDDDYSRTESLFGCEPERILVKHLDLLEPHSLVLDVGAGQGRNSIPLSQIGHSVHSLEPSEVAAESLRKISSDQNLSLEVFPESFQTHCPPCTTYAGIMVFGLIPDLDWNSIRVLLEKIRVWSRPGTVLWITGFTVQDPALSFFRRNWQEVEANSFQGPQGQFRTYLSLNQVLSLFPSCTPLFHWEGLGPPHTHGDGNSERHGKFEAVLQVAS